MDLCDAFNISLTISSFKMNGKFPFSRHKQGDEPKQANDVDYEKYLNSLKRSVSILVE